MSRPPVGRAALEISPSCMRKDWHYWIGTFTGVVHTTVAALPLAALVVSVVARRRIANGATPAWAWRMSLAEVGIVYGTVPWVWMIMLPGARAGTSLVPLRDLLTILADRGPVTLAGQVAGDLMVFAALGFFAPLRFAALASVPRVVALAAGAVDPRPTPGPWDLSSAFKRVYGISPQEHRGGALAR
ncbi:hypothetical protein [Micromonospora sp. NPDC049204]|uniref:hypothetical protein n=1 Tax=Micromonospora sp. NPDC049204 TaxID=3154351 RepID=UPI00340FBD46